VRGGLPQWTHEHFHDVSERTQSKSAIQQSRSFQQVPLARIARFMLDHSIASAGGRNCKETIVRNRVYPQLGGGPRASAPPHKQIVIRLPNETDIWQMIFAVQVGAGRLATTAVRGGEVRKIAFILEESN
jgi:hypothetical protein